MGNIKFVKEPGYTESLLWIFQIYFNKDNLALPFGGYKNSEEDARYLQEVTEAYLPISDDLRLFFYMPQSKVSFMSKYYARPYKNHFFDREYGLDTVIEALKDCDKVVDSLLRVYFPGAAEEWFQEGQIDLKRAKEAIKESRYSAEIKNALYEFVIDPVPMIDTLIRELTEKDILLAAQYEKQCDRIAELENQLDYEKIVSDIKQVPVEGVDLSKYEELFVSVGIIARQVITIKPAEDTAAIIIGLDYPDFIEYLKNNATPVELDTFGNAISEKNRVEILQFIARQKEVTQKDVERELGLTANNAYYHLTLMLKANMLNFRHQGRATLYRINKEYMEAAAREIVRWGE